MEILEVLCAPLGWLLKFTYDLSGNYLVALLLFSLIIKVGLLPLGIRQQKSMVRRTELVPKEQAIRNKYNGKTDFDSLAAINKEISNMYKEEKYSPLAGCIPMFIQLPVFFALYQIITKPLTYICDMDEAILSQLSLKVTDLLGESVKLSQINIIACVKETPGAFVSVLGNMALPDFTVLGGWLDLSQTPSVFNISWLLIIPALTLVTSYLSSYITNKTTMQSAQGAEQLGESMRYMQYMMPLMSLWISFSVPAIIGVYWIFQNVFGVAQQLILTGLYPMPKVPKTATNNTERNKSYEGGDSNV